MSNKRLHHIKEYPAKVLLFGEYIIIKGAQALAIPFDGYTARWETTAAPPQVELLDFVRYLAAEQSLNQKLDIVRFQTDLQQGLQFHSDIPIGYGLGSSGAVCAAVFDRYQLEEIKEIAFLKSILAKMESHFHGASSGIDPLICYLKEPLLHTAPNVWNTIQLPNQQEAGEIVLFLLNTQRARETSPLVQAFLKDCEDINYQGRLEAELIPYTEDAIHALQASDWKQLFDLFHQISHFQFRYFPQMLPDYLRQSWLGGLTSNYFKLKLCGAGGGGFMLGISTDWKRTCKALEHFPLLPILRFE